MIKYVIRRCIMMIFVLLGVSFLIYFLMDMAPGDPVLLALGQDVTDEQYEEAKIEMGYDKPVWYRFFKYMGNLLQGDLGYSTQYRQDVFSLYFERLPATLALAFSSTALAIVISIPLGIFAALHRGTLLDNAASVLSVLGLSAPNFWVGLLLITYFALQLGWFKSGGFNSAADVVLPAITEGTAMTALLTRTTRSSMVDVLGADYLLLARAKGVSERDVIYKHALRNALLPIITVSGVKVAGIVGGAVVTETVFSWPGVGRLIVNAINSQDVEVVTGALIMTTVITSFVVLIVDLLYAAVDPRIKAQYR